MNSTFYNETDALSICRFAQKLEQHSINQVVATFENFNSEDCVNFSGKGYFGNYLEAKYFGKKNDTKSEADFSKAGLELKASPLKKLSNFEIKVKERLVLNKFTFSDLVKETFQNSHLVSKNGKILLVFYHYEKDIHPGDLIIELADIWEFLKEDKEQIEADWNYIVNKIKAGKAHELSEGDTLYLGACTKGATKEKSMQVQPYSDIPAAGRALCFKIQYINHIFQALYQKRNYNKTLDTRFLGPNEIFQEKILSKYKPYIKMKVDKIYSKFDMKYNPDDKGRFARIARKIVGLNKNSTNLYEFNASGIQLKTIRVEPNGKMKESISFKHIDFCEIVDEEWEDSYFYGAMTSKFIFVIFKRNDITQEYHLDNIIFWQVPTKDYDYFREVWSDTKEKITKGDYLHFTRATDEKIAHIRPHGKDSKDVMLTPQGKYEKKKSFWINQKYIQSEIIDPIYGQK